MRHDVRVKYSQAKKPTSEELKHPGAHRIHDGGPAVRLWASSAWDAARNVTQTRNLICAQASSKTLTSCSSTARQLTGTGSGSARFVAPFLAGLSPIPLGAAVFADLCFILIAISAELVVIITIRWRIPHGPHFGSSTCQKGIRFDSPRPCAWLRRKRRGGYVAATRGPCGHAAKIKVNLKVERLKWTLNKWAAALAALAYPGNPPLRLGGALYVPGVVPKEPGADNLAPLGEAANTARLHFEARGK